MTTTIRKSKVSRFRTPALRASGEQLGVDRKNEIIRGVAVLQMGDLPERDPRQLFADATTFAQLEQLAAVRRGSKGRFTHPDLSNDGMGSFLGRWKNPRADGDTFRMDLHLSERSHDSPTLGDVGKYVMDFADSDPDMFGASIAVVFDDEAMKKEERGDGRQPMRFKQLLAVDIVDDPAATRDGLFSTTDGVPDQVSRLLDVYFEGVPQDELRERAFDYLDRYFTNRFGVPKMSESTKTDANPQADVEKSIATAVEAAAQKFGTLVDEKIAAAIAAAKPAETKPSDVELERKRCSELFAVAKNAGLADYEKVAQEAIDKALTVEAFKATVADRLIAANGLTKDAGGDPNPDPDAKFKKEYADNRAAFASMGTSLEEYVASRKIDEGESLLPGLKAAAVLLVALVLSLFAASPAAAADPAGKKFDCHAAQAAGNLASGEVLLAEETRAPLSTLWTVLPFLMLGAVTANQSIRMRGHCERRKVPVAASTILYEGTLCFEDAGGDFTGTVLENGSFGGIVCEQVDNSAGADAAKKADVYVTGEFLLTMDTTSLAAADIGKPVYGVDNYTITETATDLVPVGVITEVVSTTKAWVSIHGIGERDTGPLVT